MFDVLIEKYANDENLKKLGDLDELKEYLNEEIIQSQLQGFDLNSVSISESNKHNILYHYLNRKCPPPKELYHKWIDGDFPDVDADFTPRGRDAIRSYLENKFGKSNVMSVATFGKGKVKGSMQDIGETLGIPRTETVEITKAFKDLTKEESEDFDVEDEMNWLETVSEDAKRLFKENPRFKEWVEKYGKLIRGVGQHAAALVISDLPINEYLPVMRGKENAHMIALGKEELQPQGAIKYDFLGLTNIDVLEKAATFVKQNYGIELNEKYWFDVGFEHPEAYKLACRGELDGIFQLEGMAGKICTKTIQPKNFDDLAFVNAGMRPGASKAGAPETYSKHSKGQRSPDYPDVNELKKYGINDKFIDIMNSTHGIMAYQEQLLLFLHHVGGMPIPDTNKVRKVVTKPPDKRGQKEEEVLKISHEKCLKYATEIKEIPQELFDRWWNVMVGQAGYSFNKCLSKNRNEVLMINGEYKKITDIKKGDKIVSWNEVRSEWFENEVTNIIESGIKDVWEVEFDDGEKISCSLDHKFYTKNGEEKLINIGITALVKDSVALVFLSKTIQ